MTEWQGCYTVTQASRIARVPRSTLRRWRRQGIIEPSVKVLDRDQVVDEGYSHSDLTIIRIMRALREDRLDLPSVGVALRHLTERLGPPSMGWADASVSIVGSKIFAQEPDGWDVTLATEFGQKVETRPFGDLFPELRGREEPGDILVPEDFAPHVEINPQIMGGQPVIRGTRLPTSVVASLNSKGQSLPALAELYKPISRLSIEKAIAFENFLNTAVAQA